ncbi:hypothetical protein AB0C12_33400 [Actinoplanes sp. NPDC048967]
MGNTDLRKVYLADVHHFRHGRFERMWYLLDARTIAEQLAA